MFIGFQLLGKTAHSIQGPGNCLAPEVDRYNSYFGPLMNPIAVWSIRIRVSQDLAASSLPMIRVLFDSQSLCNFLYSGCGAC